MRAPPIVCSTCGAKDCTVVPGLIELVIHCPACARELERLRELERELEHLTIQDELTCPDCDTPGKGTWRK
jgi:hypothetical protein